MPRLPLMRKLRKLLYHRSTRYIHGTPVHRPGYHHHRILEYLRVGEQRGVDTLLRLTEIPE